jgi:hypothetical protein
MLFRRPVLDAIAAGSVTVAYRRWKQPRVKQGSRLRTLVGVLEIEAVDVVDPAKLTDAAARRAGHPDRASLMKALDARGDDPVYRVRFKRDAAEIESLRQRLAGMDARSHRGAWTADMLRMIAAQPGVRAPDLAASIDRETRPFKADVRKLKELGLTESLPVGYRLSPRGEAVLAAIDAT